MRKSILTAIGIFSALAMVAVMSAVQPNVNALNGSSALRSCSEDAIIRCGTLSTDELLSKYDKNANGDIAAIFNHYGIARSDIAGSTSEVKLGRVYNDGRVVVDGKTMATDAYSVARTRMSGTARTVGIGGKTYYEGPNMGIFVNRPEGYEVYVMFKNGRFHRAVMASCGNPLVGNPVAPPPAPKPAPAPAPKPAPTPAPVAPTQTTRPADKVVRYACDKIFVNKISRNEYTFSVDVTVENAQVVSYIYNYGDGTTETVNYQTVRHTYANPGIYIVTVTMNVLANGKNESVTGATCQVPVSVEAQPVVPVAAIVPQPEMCLVPGKTHFPSSSSECVAPITTTTVSTTPRALPTTGPLGALGGFLGFGSVTTAGYYWISSRRNLETAFVNKR